MIPFSAKTAFFKTKMKILKGTAKILPFPKPTLFSGPGSSLEMCEAIALMGTRRLLIVTDAMLIKIGLLDGIQAKLTELGIEFFIYDGVKPDPTIDQIEAGLGMLKQHDCEAVLAVGGGSPIDAAKVIAARATNDKPVRKMEGLFRVFRATLPLYAVPTTAGTGSEVTVAAVVSDPERRSKSAIMDPKLVPAMAALDGSLMTGLPPSITAATGMDALTHAVEAYISVNALPDTDSYALAATRLIMKNLPIVMEDGQNIEARQRMSMGDTGITPLLAAAHAELGEWDQCESVLLEAFALPEMSWSSFPDAMPAHYANARLLNHRGHRAEAVDEAQRGLDQAKGWPVPAFVAWGWLVMSDIASTPAEKRRLLMEAEMRGALHSGHHYLARAIAQAREQLDSKWPIIAADGAVAESLTRREIEVLRLFRSDLSLRDIGRELDITLNTAKGYAKTIFQKLAVNSRAEAVTVATEAGVI